MRRLINAIQIRALFAVDFDIDKMLVQKIGDGGVGE